MRHQQHPGDSDPNYRHLLAVRPGTCECDSVPVGEGDERIIPHPHCPVHEYHPGFLSEHWDSIRHEYELMPTDDGEWIPEDEWDEETAMRKEAV